MTPTRSRSQRTEKRWLRLQEWFETNDSLLTNQGSLVLKHIHGKPYWYLRFFGKRDAQGRRRQRSIYIGRAEDEDLIFRVRTLLSKWHDQHHAAREIAKIAPSAAVQMKTMREIAWAINASANGVPVELGQSSSAAPSQGG